MRVERGHLWSVALDPTIANEQAWLRPCLVVSVGQFNALPIQQAIVVPLTSRDRGLPHHILVHDGGLNQPSCWAMCEAVRAVSATRFSRLISTVDERTVEAVTSQLALWLGRP